VIAERADQHGYHELLRSTTSITSLNDYRRDRYGRRKSPNICTRPSGSTRDLSACTNDTRRQRRRLSARSPGRSDGAFVDLITDSEVGVSARINGRTRPAWCSEGGRSERFGAAVSAPALCQRGENIVTSGTVETPTTRCIPPGSRSGR